MNIITIQTAKEKFLAHFPSKYFETYNVEFKVVDADKIYLEIDSIFNERGKDIYALMSLKEQGGAESAVSLIYPDCAYVLIKNVPKINKLYLSGAVYTEMARIYVAYNCSVQRSQVFQFTFNEHCLAGYGFWTEYGTKLISYSLLAEQFPKIKSLCLDPKYIDTNFAQISQVYMNQLTGYFSLSDLYAVIMLKRGMGVNDKISFPIDSTFLTGNRLKLCSENIFEILVEQSLKEEQFKISEKVLVELGYELRKFDDALAEYRGSIGA